VNRKSQGGIKNLRDRDSKRGHGQLDEWTPGGRRQGQADVEGVRKQRPRWSTSTMIQAFVSKLRRNALEKKNKINIQGSG